MSPVRERKAKRSSAGTGTGSGASETKIETQTENAPSAADAAPKRTAARTSAPGAPLRPGLLIAAALLIGFAAYALTAVNAAAVFGLAVMLGLLLKRAPSTSLEPQRMIAGSALFLLLGLALIGIGNQEGGVGITLLSLVGMMFGIHTYGRLGPEEEAS